jgi:hypothetical protein
MTTLAVFEHLISVASGNTATMVNGKPYSVAIYGMFELRLTSNWIARRTMHCKIERLITIADNLKLESVGNVLDIQLYASNGTYVSSNGGLCFDASQQWTRRSDSVITYELDKVVCR